jgi:hypothetical protein
MSAVTLWASREGDAKVVAIESQRGIRVRVYIEDGETFVRIDRHSEPIPICEGLPLTLDFTSGGQA